MTAVEAAIAGSIDGTLGRNGLVWLIHEHRDLGPGFRYRHHIDVQVIDQGYTNGHAITWRVPNLDDEAYVHASQLERTPAMHR